MSFIHHTFQSKVEKLNKQAMKIQKKKKGSFSRGLVVQLDSS